MKLPKPDPYIVGILCAVALAALLPVRGAWVAPYGWLTKIVVATLFFLYGARLSREAVRAGLLHWRLHLVVLGLTFGLYALIALAIGLAPTSLLGPTLTMGMIYLCCMPSTVQSSVAFVAAARGDVAAAVCAASLSNLVGVVVSPLLVSVMLHARTGHGVSFDAIRDIFLELMLPFLIGQLLHPWLGPPLAARKKVLSWYDRASIIMIVYGAFSAAVVGGMWRQITLPQLGLLVVANLILLALVLWVSRAVSRLAGFPVEDEIVIVFCGTKKSLASGVPMANLMFPAATVGLMVLPLMLFHQFQLMACAWLASRYGRRPQA